MTPTATTETSTNPGLPRRRRLLPMVATSLLIVFIVVAALAAAGLWWRHDEILYEGQRRAEVLTDILAHHLALRFERLDAALYEVAAHDRVIGGPGAPADEWFPVLGAAFSGLAGITSLSVADAHGIITYSTQPMMMRQPVSDGALYRQLSANPRSDALVLDALLRDPVEGQVLLPAGRALRTVNGEFEGMLVVFFLPESLGDLFSAADLAPSGVLRIYSSSGQRLIPTPEYSDSLDQPPPEFPLTPSAEGEDATAVTVAPIAAEGEPYLTAYRTMAGTGLTIAVSFPEADLLTSWRDEMKVVIAGLALLGIALILAGVAIGRSARASSDSTDRT